MNPSNDERKLGFISNPFDNSFSFLRFSIAFSLVCSKFRCVCRYCQTLWSKFLPPPYTPPAIPPANAPKPVCANGVPAAAPIPAPPAACFQTSPQKLPNSSLNCSTGKCHLSLYQITKNSSGNC